MISIKLFKSYGMRFRTGVRFERVQIEPYRIYWTAFELNQMIQNRTHATYDLCTTSVQFEQYFHSNRMRVQFVLDASTSQTQVELTCKLNTIRLTRMPKCYGVGFTRALNLVMSWTCVWYHQGKFDLHFGIIWDVGLSRPVPKGFDGC